MYVHHRKLSHWKWSPHSRNLVTAVKQERGRERREGEEGREREGKVRGCHKLESVDTLYTIVHCDSLI